MSTIVGHLGTVFIILFTHLCSRSVDVRPTRRHLRWEWCPFTETLILRPAPTPELQICRSQRSPSLPKLSQKVTTVFVKRQVLAIHFGIFRILIFFRKRVRFFLVISIIKKKIPIIIAILNLVDCAADCLYYLTDLIGRPTNVVWSFHWTVVVDVLVAEWHLLPFVGAYSGA